MPGFRDQINTGLGSICEKRRSRWAPQLLSGREGQEAAGWQGGAWASEEPKNHLLGSLQLDVDQPGFGE